MRRRGGGAKFPLDFYKKRIIFYIMKTTLAQKKTMSFSLTARARAIIEALAVRDGVTMSTALELALREIIKQQKLDVIRN